MSEKKMTLKSIAGYCIEEALWKFVIDITVEIQEKKFVLGGNIRNVCEQREDA